MRVVHIYVENQKIDLYSDEKIEVTSSVQNISDLSKVFTDYSQTFTIPATKANNAIFEHYYNNDFDTTIDHNKRRTARIEIDYIPFRTGKVQLEKGDIKKGKPESYQITFFGDVVNLKDKFGDDLIGDLDYSTLDHTYNGDAVKDRINTPGSTTDYNVRYPLVSSSRVWQSGGGGANDITTNGGAIHYTELFPAVRVKTILELIQAQYGVTFTGAFLNSLQFTKLFMWFKNIENYVYFSPPSNVTFPSDTGLPKQDRNYFNNQVNYRYREPSSLDSTAYLVRHSLVVNITTASSVPYYLDVFLDGVYQTSLYSTGGNKTFNVVTNQQNSVGLNPFYKFSIRSQSGITYGGTVVYTLSWNQLSGGGTTYHTYVNTANIDAKTTVVNTNLKGLAPNIKVIDFLTGLVNMFNWTITPDGVDTYKINTLEGFYQSGEEKNLTKYVIRDNIDVRRPKLFNEISFSYQQSNSFINRQYADFFGREYASLKNAFNYDGGDFKIELPFETILMSKFTGTNLQVGYCLGTPTDYKNYVPKPVLFYQDSFKSTSVSFKFDNGGTISTQTGYVPFGQTINYNSINYTINFNTEIGSLSEISEDDGLYKTYYQSYLTNLFSPKTRVLNVKCILPTPILTGLKLNDSILIRDKKYLINDLRQDLTSGEVDLELVTNWRNSVTFGGGATVSSSGGSYEGIASIPDGYEVFVYAPISETPFSTISDAIWSGEQLFTIDYTQNLTGSRRFNTYLLEIYKNGELIGNEQFALEQLA